VSLNSRLESNREEEEGQGLERLKKRAAELGDAREQAAALAARRSPPPSPYTLNSLTGLFI